MDNVELKKSNRLKWVWVLILFSLFTIHFSFCSAQSKKIDSLRNVLRTEPDDTSRVKNLYTLSSRLKDSLRYDTALTCATHALELAQKLDYKKGIAVSYRMMAMIYDDGYSNYPKALELYQQSLDVNAEIRDKSGMARNLGSMGADYWMQGNYPKALAYHLRALSLDEEVGDKIGVAADMSNLGNTYADMGNNPKGLEYDFKALEMYLKLGDKDGIGTNYINIGSIYDVEHRYSEALEYTLKALKIYQDMGSKSGVAIILGNVGSIYDEQATATHLNHTKAWSDSLYKKALEFEFKGLALDEETEDKRLTAYTWTYIGNTYTHISNYKMANCYYDSSLALAKEIGYKELIRDSYKGMAVLDSATGNTTSALQYFKKFIIYRDSITNEANTKKSVQAEMNYEFEKKQATEKAEQDKKDAVVEQERKKQAIIRNSFLGGLVLTLVLVFFIFKGYKQKKKDNIIITRQKEEVEKSRKKVMDSIKYAQKIQYSLLPSAQEIKQYMDDYFVYLLPKDVVSGDFYWFHHSNGLSYLAVVDCTGHGVPGACMSMLAHSFLNEAVIEKKITEPAEILAHMHELVFKTLHQQQGDEYSQDGMDMSLLVMDHTKNRATFAGAKNSAFIVEGENIKVLKATSKSIGGLSLIGEIEPTRQFKSETVELNKGALLILSTDGIFDQLNNQDEKFGKARFNALAQSLFSMQMEQGKKTTEATIHNWKGSLTQQDDILLMGVRI